MNDPVFVIGAVAAVLFGAVIGSFLNVVIFRLPSGQSLVFPASHCPKCDYPLQWYDNIPVLSWLALRGRCRKCRQAISAQYPLVESLNAALYLLVFLRFGLTPASAIYCLLVSALVAATFIDLRWYIIPDEITLPGVGIGVALAAAHSLRPIAGLQVRGFVDAALGVLLGGGILLAIGYLGSWYLAWRLRRFGRGAEPLPDHARGDDDEDLELMAMGGGDIKLMAMVGAFLGWRGAYITLVAASVVGALVGSTLLLQSRKGFGHRIPFGPYIALGALLTLLASEPMIRAYQSLVLVVGRWFGMPV